jgi:transposase InsO family protein
MSNFCNETSSDVIRALKSTFARYGGAYVVFSNNGPCYSSAEFTVFAENDGFRHDTSSPKYAQSNGAAEKAVQTAKTILSKADDPYLALLSYRTTPLIHGYLPV